MFCQRNSTRYRLCRACSILTRSRVFHFYFGGRGSISKLAQSLRCHYPHLNAIKLGLGSAVAVEEENDEDEVFDEATVISLIQTSARLVRIEMMMDNFTNKICKALLVHSQSLGSLHLAWDRELREKRL